MKVWLDAIGGATPHDNRYVTKLDTDVDGFQADIETTDDLTKALTWPSMAEALADWKAVSSLLPVRPDGRPNRPGCAYNVLVETVSAAQVDDAYDDLGLNGC